LAGARSFGERAYFELAQLGYNILCIGPPGSGKSMIAKRIPSILPPLTLREAIETTKVHSICGLLNGQYRFVTNRPFRRQLAHQNQATRSTDLLLFIAVPLA
jgi:predicted ATPase with chaperone activity